MGLGIRGFRWRKDVIDCVHHKAPGGGRNRVLLVMLPGVGIEPGAFADRGLVASVHERGLPVDVVAAGPRLDLYLDGTIATALHHAIVEPALRQGYARLWFLGISLGGMGALLYAGADAAPVEGMVLLAPFLGTQGTIAEIAGAGGLASWQAGASAATAPECRMLAWLQQFLARPPARPAVYLGYGRGDRFSQGHRMLAERLPDLRVVTTEGGHDWKTWAALWRRILDAEPFATPANARRLSDRPT
jgi:pimeloyl-ACP methyl ester carboxylesterase